MSNIEEEQRVHGDILQDDFLDSYNNLTLKTIHIVKYFVREVNYEHLFKTDDDSFVNMGKNYASFL